MLAYRAMGCCFVWLFAFSMPPNLLGGWCTDATEIIVARDGAFVDELLGTRVDSTPLYTRLNTRGEAYAGFDSNGEVWAAITLGGIDVCERFRHSTDGGLTYIVGMIGPVFSSISTDLPFEAMRPWIMAMHDGSLDRSCDLPIVRPPGNGDTWSDFMFVEP